MSLFQYRRDTFNCVVKAVDLQLFHYQIPATLVLMWMIKKAERDWAIERDMRREREREEGADIDSCPNRAAFQDIRATAAPRQPKQIRLQPRYQTASAISNSHKQTLSQPAAGLLTNCQTALGHLSRWGGGGGWVRGGQPKQIGNVKRWCDRPRSASSSKT